MKNIAQEMGMTGYEVAEYDRRLKIMNQICTNCHGRFKGKKSKKYGLCFKCRAS